MDTAALAKLRAEARALDPADRAHLALELLQSLDGEASTTIEQAWNDEADRRLAQFDGGGVEAIPAEAVHAAALARLR